MVGTPLVEQAMKSFDEAVKHQPTLAWAWNDSGLALRVRADSEAERGVGARLGRRLGPGQGRGGERPGQLEARSLGGLGKSKAGAHQRQKGRRLHPSPSA